MRITTDVQDTIVCTTVTSSHVAADGRGKSSEGEKSLAAAQSRRDPAPSQKATGDTAVFTPLEIMFRGSKCLGKVKTNREKEISIFS